MLNFRQIENSVLKYLRDTFNESYIVCRAASQSVVSLLHDEVLFYRKNLIENQGGFSSFNRLQSLQNRKIQLTLYGEFTLKHAHVLRQISLSLLVLTALVFFAFTPRLFYSKVNKIYLFYAATQEQVYRNGSTNPLETFLRSDHLNLIKGEETILVELRKKRIFQKSQSRNLVVTRSASLYLYRHALTFPEKFILLFQSVARFFSILVKKDRLRTLGVILPEILIDIPVSLLCVKRSLISGQIRTESNNLIQPVFFFSRNPETLNYVIWTSSNSIPVRPNNLYHDLFDDSIFFQQDIDHNFVWTDSHKLFLRNYTSAQIWVKGPMLLYPGTLDGRETDASYFEVQVFDVTPYSSPLYLSSMYSSESMKNFLSSILDVCQEFAISSSESTLVTLKPKRSFYDAHDDNYLRFITQRVDSGDLRLLDPSLDLYGLISKADFVICIPFTSPAIIAKSLGVPVCYFFSNVDFSLDSHVDGIPVVDSAAELLSLLKLSISGRN